MSNRISQVPLYLMIIPGLLLVLLFSYGPMVGVIIAFQKFIPAKGFFGDQQWVGLDNFKYVISLPNIYQVVWNTVYIAFLKMVFGLIVPIVVAIMLNEVRKIAAKRIVQTTIYLPHFLSWVILAGILIDILSPSTGIVNLTFKWTGFQPVYYLGSTQWFPFVLVISEVWKEFGFGTIVYIAAIAGIDPQLYEAAEIDGANRFHKIYHLTLPGIRMVIVLLALLSLGNILNAGFEQVFNLYSPQVYQSGDIIDTFVYRLGMVDAQYSVATAVGLFKSLVSLILVSFSYFMAYRYANYRIF